MPLARPFSALKYAAFTKGELLRVYCLTAIFYLHGAKAFKGLLMMDHLEQKITLFGFISST